MRASTRRGLTFRSSRTTSRSARRPTGSCACSTGRSSRPSSELVRPGHAGALRHPGRHLLVVLGVALAVARDRGGSRASIRCWSSSASGTSAARRGRTALIVVGLMLGTTIVATALTTGDTMSHTIRGTAVRTLGQTDELVSAKEPSSASERVSARPPGRVLRRGRRRGRSTPRSPARIWSTA